MSPVPRFGEPTRLKEFPCGNGQRNDWGATYTPLKPGIQDITWRETINHNGAPYRIALTVENDDHYDEFVLIDHIPHNDQGVTNENNPPGKYHRIKVNIPDVNCSKCAIQLIQIMSDKFTAPCPNPGGLPTSCGNPSFAYFSCANVKISGRHAASGMQPFYFSYTGGSGSARKPYIPKESSMAWTLVDKYWTLSINGTNNDTDPAEINPQGIKPSDIRDSIVNTFDRSRTDTQMESESDSQSEGRKSDSQSTE